MANASGQTFNKTKDNFFVKPSKAAHVNTNSKSKSNENREKKPFDKNRWRLQKYSMKHKVESWEERRKKAIVRGYNKERSGDKTTFDVSKIYDEEERRMEEDDGNKRCKVFKKPHEQFLEKKEEKRRKREEFLKAKAEKEKAMENCKKRKVEKYKKLNRKTRRGQPIMKERMEYLLEKIQKSIDA